MKFSRPLGRVGVFFEKTFTKFSLSDTNLANSIHRKIKQCKRLR